MYELLKKLRNHTDEFEEVISLISPYMSDESLELSDTDSVTIDVYCKNLEQTDIFLLLGEKNATKNILDGRKDRWKDGQR